MDLQKLKKDYSDIEKKYKLPSFEKLNENFEVDKIDKDTDMIARAIRKAMIDKVVNSLNFLEMLLNQVNTPRLYMPFLRTMTIEDKKIIDNMYSSLGELTIISLELEVEYSERQETDAIRKIYDIWESLKPSFKKIIAKIRKPSAPQMKKEKSYFG